MKKKNSSTIFKLIYILPVLYSLTTCISSNTVSAFTLEEHLASFDRISGESRQLLVVTDDKFLFFSRIKVYALEKSGDKWQLAIEPVNAVIGKNGFANPGEKREGDGRTPSGIYPLFFTFGYDAKVKTRMPYRQALADDLWIDDVNAADYNRWVKATKTHAVSYEKMRRSDNLYKYGIVIEYNTNPVIKGYGSAIFFHVWGGEGITTEGCVAVSENDIIEILKWLNPEAKPLIIMGAENFIKELLKPRV